MVSGASVHFGCKVKVHTSKRTEKLKYGSIRDGGCDACYDWKQTVLGYSLGAWSGLGY
jgi:hypothetical protein